MYNKSIVYKTLEGCALAIITWKIKIKKKFFFVLLISSLIISCSVAKKPFELKKKAAKYAESIYNRQNKATQQIIILSEEYISVTEEESLSVAELQMYEACYLLNEAANLEMEGKKINLYLQKQVRESLKGCDNSVDKMEVILKAIPNNINTEWER